MSFGFHVSVPQCFPRPQASITDPPKRHQGYPKAPKPFDRATQGQPEGPSSPPLGDKDPPKTSTGLSQGAHGCPKVPKRAAEAALPRLPRFLLVLKTIDFVATVCQNVLWDACQCSPMLPKPSRVLPKATKGPLKTIDFAATVRQNELRGPRKSSQMLSKTHKMLPTVPKPPP